MIITIDDNIRTINISHNLSTKEFCLSFEVYDALSDKVTSYVSLDIHLNEQDILNLFDEITSTIQYIIQNKEIGADK